LPLLPDWQNFQTSSSRPQQAVGSQLSASDSREVVLKTVEQSNSEEKTDWNVGPNHRQKMASDPFYRQACLERPRNWRAAHPVPLYWKQYRLDHPYISATKVNLANNNLAFDLKHSAKPSILETVVTQSWPSQKARLRYRPPRQEL